jgi:two-component system phosphate regulon response regulator PhoB
VERSKKAVSRFSKAAFSGYTAVMARILVLEDDDALREAVSGYLKLADFEVTPCHNFEELNRALSKGGADFLISDINLPDGDGFVYVKELRKRSDLPVMFISVRDSESDRITGFEVGGDDYLTKPFSAKELVLRVKAILRRTLKKVEDPSIEYWELSGQQLLVDRGSHKALLNNIPLKLTAAEWKILLYLSGNTSTVVSRSQIIDRCLEYSFEGYDRTVDTHIKNLRSKLGTVEWIETVRGYGYRFAGVKKE